MFELLVKGMTPKQVNKRTKHFQYTGLARTKFPICLILFRVCVQRIVVGLKRVRVKRTK